MAYAQVVYPLLMILLAGRRDESSAESDSLPKVSLIIPAHNEEAVLDAKLANVLAIDYPSEHLEILVGSDGSQDETNEIARGYEQQGVRLLDFPQRRGKASVVNDAVDMATGDVICLCDANVMFFPDALRVLVAQLADPSVGAATGDVRLASEEANFGEGEQAYYGVEKRLQVAESALGSVMGVDGGMYVLRRELFQPLESDTILDDFVVSIRVMNQGRRVVYEPSAVATESGTPTAKQEYRRRVRVSAGAVQTIKRGNWPSVRHPVLLWQYLSHKVLRWAGPMLLVAMLFANIMLVERGRLYVAALSGQCAIYLLAALATVSLKLRATRIGGVVFYFVMSHVAIADGLVRGIFNRQKVTWAQAERGSEATSQEAAAAN